MNFAIYEGRLTDEPFYRTGDSNNTEALKMKDKLPESLRDKSYMQFTVASDNTRGDTEKTMYITCYTYGSLADELYKVLYKGVKVVVSGIPYLIFSRRIPDMGLNLKECEIVSHTLAYTSRHREEIERQREDEIYRQQKEYESFIRAFRDEDGVNYSDEEIENIKEKRRQNRGSKLSEEDVQGFTSIDNRTPGTEQKPVKTRAQTWEEIERELMQSDEKEESSLGATTDDEEFINVPEGFKAPWEE